jgi:predicted nucleotidyltransferase
MKQEEKIRNLVSQILRSFHPQKIILFGSHAYGKADADSDVDLLVIMTTRKNTLDAAAAVRQAIEHNFSIDIIVRTPEQIKNRLKWGTPL